MAQRARQPNPRRRRESRQKPRDEHIWRPPEGERDDGEAIRRRVEWTHQFLGVKDLRRLAAEVDRFQARKLKMQSLPRASADADGAPLRSEVQTVGHAALRASLTENPADSATWGHTGRYIEVEAAPPFASASLRFKLGEGNIAHLYPGSILVARWEKEAGRFSILPQSGFNQAGGYVYARITRPGIYTAIGVPRDPRLVTTLRLFSLMRPWMRMDRKEGRLFIDRICQLILCADFMQEVIRDPQGLAEFGLEPNDFPGGFGGGNICDQCLGIDSGRLPEIDLLDIVDLPLDVIKPSIIFPPIWPKPCPTWVNLGPVNVTGRTGVLAIHPSNGNVLYAGTTGGGVWQSSNGGGSWLAKMSNELSLAVGGLGIAASDPNVLYAGTGEWTAGIGWPVDPVIRGVGVYRTGNEGNDWDLCAPISSQNCAAVAVDPTDPNRVFVAGETALHRSTNGGASWDVAPGMVNGVFDGEVSDVVVDPNDIDRLYIGVHRDGVYRSTDGGNSWTRLETGIDTGSIADAPKITLGRNGAHGSQFIVVKMGDRVYTSTNGGNTFTRKTDVGNPIWFTAWANVMAVDPQNENILLAGASNLYRSTNGGNSWTQVGGYGTNVHPDMQSVVFDPNNHNHVYVANDGGIWSSNDNGVTWSFISRGLVATHFYVMGISQTPTLRYGGSIQDDNGYTFNGVPDWVSLAAGEGGYVEYDPSNEQVIYHDAWFSQLRKTTNGGATWNTLGIDTDTNYAEPLTISRSNSNLLLALKTTGAVSRSTNGGTTWTDVLNPGVSFSAVQFAPSDDHHAFVGSTSGRVWHSSDRGVNWTELDTTALPNAKIQSLVADWANPRRVYVAFAGTGIHHLFRGDVDAVGNVTWFDVSGVLPAVSLPDLPLTGLALHPVQDEVMYVSTLLGVLRSTDGGDSWAPFDEGLPNAFVSDLDMRSADRSLFASTMGRGIYRRYV
jgi:photosystem II stability/assembly factor-like uncharacterized protein